MTSQINVLDDLRELYRQHEFSPGAAYSGAVAGALAPGLSYGTAAFYGITATILSSKRMIAYNLVQNSIDEAKGGSRIQLVADRYAPPELQKKMKRHVGEELKHSKQFGELVPITGYRTEEVADNKPELIEEVLEFDDDLHAFICRVHSIEIRSWTVLRIYQQVLSERRFGEITDQAIPVLDDIMQDEINHVVYTGRQLDEWLRANTKPGLLQTLDECFAHTNRETWQDMSSMVGYLAKNYAVALELQPAIHAA